MRLSIFIKLSKRKLKKVTPNPIYEYSELIEVLRDHGFVHRTQMDIGFINDDATEELVQETIRDACERLWWLGVKGIVAECFVQEIGETTDYTQMIKNKGKKS